MSGESPRLQPRPQTQPRVQAVIFDWAGTTIDYGCLAPVEAFRTLLAGHGLTVEDADVRRFMGRDKREHLRLLLGLPHVAQQWSAHYGRAAGEEDIERMYEELGPLLDAAVSRFAAPIEGVP